MIGTQPVSHPPTASACAAAPLSSIPGLETAPRPTNQIAAPARDVVGVLRSHTAYDHYVKFLKSYDHYFER